MVHIHFHGEIHRSLAFPHSLCSCAASQSLTSHTRVNSAYSYTSVKSKSIFSRQFLTNISKFNTTTSIPPQSALLQKYVAQPVPVPNTRAQHPQRACTKPEVRKLTQVIRALYQYRMIPDVYPQALVTWYAVLRVRRLLPLMRTP